MDDAPTPTSIKPLFRSCDSTVYELCDGKTVSMVISDLSLPPIAPLPTPPMDDTLPSVYDRPGLPPLHPGVENCMDNGECGVEPPLDEPPFWINEDEENDDPDYISSPYSSVAALKQNRVISESESDYLSKKAEHIKTVCSRQSSVRFQQFVDRVQIQPAEAATAQGIGNTIPSIYNRPRMSTVAGGTSRSLPLRTEKFYASDKVESTIASFLDEWPHIAPFPGLNDSEINIFCGRLDLIESRPGTIAGGWQDFSLSVMDLTADDIQMFDECSCKYRVQVVQLVLYHWLKLYQLERQSGTRNKCILDPTKENIVRKLRDMNKIDLLYKLNWQEEFLD